MGYQHVGSVIYSGTLPDTWADMDLSSLIGGAKRVLAYFKMTTDDLEAWQYYMVFRPKDDDPGIDGIPSVGDYGTLQTRLNLANTAVIAACPTNADGVVQFKNDLAGGTDKTITFLGYEDDIIYLNQEVHNGVFGSGFQTKDLSPWIGSQSALVLLKVEGTTNAILQFQAADSSLGTVGTSGVNRVGYGDGDIQYLLVATDGNGHIKWESYTPTAAFIVDILYYVGGDQGWLGGRTRIFDDGADGFEAPPLVYGNLLDLSPVVGANRVTVYLEMETEVKVGTQRYAFRPSDQTYDWLRATGWACGIASAVGVGGSKYYYVTQTGPDGRLDWKASVDTTKVKVDLFAYGLLNLPPTFTNKLPTGVTEKPYVDISFSVEDDSQVDADTIDLDLVGPSSTLHAIIDGAFQEGFGGTITPNASNGFNVLLSTHPLIEEGIWTAEVEADDDVGETGNDSWNFTTEWIPELINARATGRRIVEIQWDLPVRVRDTAIQPQDGVDRYTPVDWLALGGLADDGANPANYSIVRPTSGNLSQDGEAVDLLPVRADETESAWYDESAIRYSDKLDVKVDFQQTARTDYRITIGALASPHQDSIGGDLDFFGFTPSKIQRGSLNLWDMLSKGHRRDDRDGTGDLLRFFTAFQEVLDRMIEDVDAFFLELCDIDNMRSEFLATLLFDLGDPLGYLFDLTSLQKRKLARTLVGIYREKGTCKGIINAVRLFVGVTLTGCSGGWYAGDTWELAEGTYPNEVGGNELGISTYLGGSGYDLNSFWVTSPIALTQEQRDQITAIANYTKPADAHFLGIIEP